MVVLKTRINELFHKRQIVGGSTTDPTDSYTLQTHLYVTGSLPTIFFFFPKSLPEAESKIA